MILPAFHGWWQHPGSGGRQRRATRPTEQAAVIAAVCSTPLAGWLLGQPTFAPPGERAWLASGVAIGAAALALARHRRQLAWCPTPLAAAFLLPALPATLGAALPACLSALIAVVLATGAIRLPRTPCRTVPFLLLVLAIPMIDALQFFVGYPMRLGACLLNELQPGVHRWGTLLSDGQSLVGVDPGCSGVRTLWCSWFFATLMAQRHGLGGGRSACLLAAATLVAFAANTVRIGLIFHHEAGHLGLPDSFHPGIGLVLLGGCLLAISQLAGPIARMPAPPRPRPSLVTAAVLLAALFLHHSPRPGSPLELHSLGRLALRPVEAPGLREWFGGEASIRQGGDALVVTRPGSSLLLPAATLLERNGFEVHACPVFEDRDGQLWGRHVAHRGDERWLVLERYLDPRGRLLATDAPAAWWLARLGPAAGMPTAVTVLERLPATPAKAPAIAALTPSG